MRFFDWEGRPAAIEGGFAWFIPEPGTDWEPANFAEVVDSGTPLASEDAMRTAFSKTFPNIPILPIAHQSSLPISASAQLRGKQTWPGSSSKLRPNWTLTIVLAALAFLTAHFFHEFLDRRRVEGLNAFATEGLTPIYADMCLQEASKEETLDKSVLNVIKAQTAAFEFGDQGLDVSWWQFGNLLWRPRFSDPYLTIVFRTQGEGFICKVHLGSKIDVSQVRSFNDISAENDAIREIETDRSDTRY
ncbi:MAG: hypothetical protein AB7F74_05050 [Parvibaculaceae bacterium]